MAKFTFPLSLEQVKSVIKEAEAKKLFTKLGDDEDPITYFFSCLKMGWMNKCYHKESQGNKAEELKKLKELLKNDPALKARLEKHNLSKGV
jgi:hypothetical protein